MVRSFLHCAKNWTRIPSASGSYSSLASRQKILLFKKFKLQLDFLIDFWNTSRCTNRLMAGLSNNDYYKVVFVGTFLGRKILVVENFGEFGEIGFIHQNFPPLKF